MTGLYMRFWDASRGEMVEFAHTKDLPVNKGCHFQATSPPEVCVQTRTASRIH